MYSSSQLLPSACKCSWLQAKQPCQGAMNILTYSCSTSSRSSSAAPASRSTSHTTRQKRAWSSPSQWRHTCSATLPSQSRPSSRSSPCWPRPLESSTSWIRTPSWKASDPSLLFDPIRWHRRSRRRPSPTGKPTTKKWFPYFFKFVMS